MLPNVNVKNLHNNSVFFILLFLTVLKIVKHRSTHLSDRKETARDSYFYYLFQIGP